MIRPFALKICALTLIFHLFSISLCYAGFFDKLLNDVGNAIKDVGDAVTKGLNQALGQNMTDDIDPMYCEQIMRGRRLSAQGLNELFQKGDYDNVICYALELKKLAHANDDKETEVFCYHALASAYEQRSRGPQDFFEKVSLYAGEGLKASDDLKDKKVRDYSRMGFLQQLAMADMKLSKPSEALKRYDESILIARALNNKMEEASGLNQMGAAYMMLGNYVEAKKLLRQSLDINDEAYFPMSYQYLGLAHWGSEEYSEAVGFFGKAVEFSKKQGEGVEGPLYSLALSYLLDGNREKANKIFMHKRDDLSTARFYLLDNEPAKAVNILTRFVGNDNVAFSLGALSGAYAELGLAYEKMRDAERSQENYKKAVEIVERERDSLSVNDRLLFLDGMCDPPFKRYMIVEGLIRVSEPEQAFYYSESLKARSLLDQLSASGETTYFDIPSELRQKERSLNNELAALVKKQFKAMQKKDVNTTNSLEKEISAARQERDSFIETLRKSYAEYVLISYPKPLKLSEIALRPNEVLIEYAVTESKTQAWLIKEGRILKSISINIRKRELDKIVDAFRESISDPKSLRTSDFNSEAGYKLYSMLIGDFLPFVNAKERIIIVPDKKLGLLPFEALVTSEPSNQKIVKGKYGYYPANSVYLGDKYEISYYYSASALTMARTLKRHSKPERTLFILSDPVFDSTDIRLKGKTQLLVDKREGNLMRAVEDGTGLKLARLDQTSDLAKTLLKMYERKGTVHLSGNEANASNLKKQDLFRYRYLVFATHGLLDNKISGIMEPALVLSQVGNEKGENGFLTMSKVMGLKLNADVAALTACETGSGKLISGEGVMGLGRAFQYAGAKSVLASLWSVAEDSTVKLVERFFYYQNTGKDRLTALKLARLDIRSEGYEHPFYWSPFILIGEGD